MSRGRSCMGYLMGLLCLVSCKSDPFADCFNSTGPEITEKRILVVHPESLEIKDNVDVIWHRSDSSYLVVTCGRNLARKVTTELKNNTLTIRNINRCNWVREYHRDMHIDLYCHEPNTLFLKGYGDFRCADTLQVERLSVHQYGAGNSFLLLQTGQFSVDFNCPGEMTLTGNSSQTFYYTQDVGRLHAEGLEAEVVNVKVEGDNDVWVNALDSLKGAILTPRTLYYKGKPRLEIALPAGGKVIPATR